MYVFESEAICKSCQIPSGLFTFMFWLGYCNSAMNPFIYAFSSREFRKYVNIKIKWNDSDQVENKLFFFPTNRAYKGILQCDLHYRKENRKEIEKYSKTRLKSKESTTIKSNDNNDKTEVTFNNNITTRKESFIERETPKIVHTSYDDSVITSRKSSFIDS